LSLMPKNNCRWTSEVDPVRFVGKQPSDVVRCDSHVPAFPEVCGCYFPKDGGGNEIFENLRMIDVGVGEP
jgi:hypothetical protein